MSRLEEFRAANPDLEILPVTDSSFADFGVIYNYPLAEIEDVMNHVTMPESGSTYLQSIPELEKTEAIQAIGRDVFAGMPIDAGATIGHTDDFSAFEYHQCSELNIMLDDVVMFLLKGRPWTSKEQLIRAGMARSITCQRARSLNSTTRLCIMRQSKSLRVAIR